jgi:beta-galactosidase
MKPTSFRLGLITTMIFSIVSPSFAAFTRVHYTINSSPWRFIRKDTASAQTTAFNDAGWQTVSIPHDFNGGIDGVNNDVYKGPQMYRGIGWYRKHFTIESQYSAKKVFVEFEAVSLISDVWVNGQYVGNHKGGYTAFSYDITPYVVFGADNVLAVKANSANDSSVAPWAYQLFAAYPSKIGRASCRERVLSCV